MNRQNDGPVDTTDRSVLILNILARIFQLECYVSAATRGENFPMWRRLIIEELFNPKGEPAFSPPVIERFIARWATEDDQLTFVEWFHEVGSQLTEMSERLGLGATIEVSTSFTKDGESWVHCRFDLSGVRVATLSRYWSNFQSHSHPKVRALREAPVPKQIIESFYLALRNLLTFYPE